METLDQPVKSRRLFLRADGRSYKAKRYQVIRHNLIASLQGDPTVHQLAMIESAASVQLQLEVLRSKQVNSEDVDPHLLLKLSNSLRRHLRDLALSETDVR
jgi:hypothetical protein